MLALAACAAYDRSGASQALAALAADPQEAWTVLPGGPPIPSAAFDGSGNLIAVANGITKLSPAGAVVWQIPLPACAVAPGPGDTIYVDTGQSVVKLAPSGTMIWSRPLDPRAVGCGDTFDGFVHNIAVGGDGAVAIHGDTGVARWDADGNLSWAFAVEAHGQYGVAIEPSGAVDVAVSQDEPIDLVRFTADGAPLDGIEHITSQYHGMFVVDATGRLLAAASGHSHSDAFRHSVRLADPDFAPTGICAAGSDVAWVYQHSDDTQLARDWTVHRYRRDGGLAWSHDSFVEEVDLQELGSVPLDIAGAADGHIAIVGSLSALTYQGAWITVFRP